MRFPRFGDLNRANFVRRLVRVRPDEVEGERVDENFEAELRDLRQLRRRQRVHLAAVYCLQHVERAVEDVKHRMVAERDRALAVRRESHALDRTVHLEQELLEDREPDHAVRRRVLQETVHVRRERAHLVPSLRGGEPAQLRDAADELDQPRGHKLRHVHRQQRPREVL